MRNMYLAFVLSIASGGIVFAVQPSEPVSWISHNFPPALGTMTETEEANEWAVLPPHLTFMQSLPPITLKSRPMHKP